MFFWKSKRNCFEQHSHFIILHWKYNRIVGLKRLKTLVNKLQCTTNGFKALCLCSTRKWSAITNARIIRSCRRALIVVCITITHKITSDFYSSLEVIFKWISMQLQAYCRIILWAIIHQRKTQLLDIKLEVIIVLNNTCKYNIMKHNINNKMSDDLLKGLFCIV